MNKHRKFAAIFFFFLFAAPIVASADPGKWATDVKCGGNQIYYAGEKVEYKFHLSNVSDGDMDIDYKLAVQARGFGTLEFEKATVLLGAGKWMDRESTVGLPEKAPSGTYSIMLIARADGDSKIEMCSFQVIGEE